jgi:hypothetical protein
MTEFEDELREATEPVFVQWGVEHHMTWPDRFLEFFQKIEEPFSVVLGADGCREGWLQGEFYRRFQDNGVQVNSSNSGRKHDLHCQFPTEMLAEIKIYKTDIRGRRIKDRVKAKGAAPLSIDDIDDLRPPEGSYLADVSRLMRMSTPEERYMIVVIAALAIADDRAISKLHVVPRNREREGVFKSFRVRISRLQSI